MGRRENVLRRKMSVETRELVVRWLHRGISEKECAVELAAALCTIVSIQDDPRGAFEDIMAVMRKSFDEHFSG